MAFANTSLREATKLHPSGYKGRKMMTTSKRKHRKTKIKTRDHFAFQADQPKPAFSLPISLPLSLSVETQRRSISPT